MVKRSPRYPRHNLVKSIDMTRKLFVGAHQAKIDVDTAAKVIGYAGSGGGAASSALGALRQFGLVDGLRGDVAVSELAMKILEPMDEHERNTALREAAMKPEIFDRIVTQFNGKLPPSDEPIRSFLIRNEGFSASGADELIGTLRETFSNLPTASSSETSASADELGPKTESATTQEDGGGHFSAARSDPPAEGELITLPLGQNCKAELRLVGEVTAASYSRLIKHLELLREIAAEENE